MAVASPARVIPLRQPRSARLILSALTAATLLAVIVLYAVTNAAIDNARTGLQVIGHTSGPQAAATADLYFALSDMDAQVADILLMGRDQNLGIGRSQALARYANDRARADSGALQAAELVGADPADRRTVQAVMEGLGQYEQLAEQAIVLDDQAGHPAGPPPADVLAVYERATDLMKTEVLPQAYNLTLDAGVLVRHAYAAESGSAQAGEAGALLAGAVLLLLLIGTQAFLAIRCRRLVSPPLLFASIALLVLLVMSISLLATVAAQLQTAKVDGFDAVLALSRARAISNAATADESRYLLDPGRADIYTQTYLDKSQSVLYVTAGSITQYDGAIGPVISSYHSGKVGFLGFLGAEARGSTSPAALATVLDRYAQVQRDDQRMRALAGAGQVPAAIGIQAGASLQDFDQYDAALTALLTRHQATYASAVQAGDQALNGWGVLLPAAAILIAVLAVAGVAPRLLEYR